jgi:predicted metal-binding protein
MARIGIVTCSNMTHDLACSSFKCLEDSHTGKGTFARYAERGGAQVVGIISCSGCPTRLVPEKIVRRVRTLAASGVEAIHFAACMENLCPFKGKYMSILQAEFPAIEFVAGTHEAPTEEAQAAIGQFVCEGLTQKHLSMADLLESRREAKDA